LLPKKYFKKHSLESWGYRLGVLKDEYEGDPLSLTRSAARRRSGSAGIPTMEDYCAQDVEVTEKLLDTLLTGKTGRPWFVPGRSRSHPPRARGRRDRRRGKSASASSSISTQRSSCSRR
jgi:hypothetical protein